MFPLSTNIGATASKIPPNNPNPLDLTSAIVVSGLASINTQHPTDSATPYVVAYDVKDSASPPNRAITVRRRVQVVCPSGEIVCPINDDGSLSCSTFGGSCAFAGTTTVASSTFSQISAPTVKVGGASASGPSMLPSASTTAASGAQRPSTSASSAQSSSSDASQQATAPPAIPSIRYIVFEMLSSANL